MRQQHRRGEHGGADEQAEADQVALGEVVIDRHVEADDQRGYAGLDQAGKEYAARDAPVGEEERHQQHRQEGQRRRVDGFFRPVRITFDDAFEGKFLLAIGVVHAPVGSGPAFHVHFPGLVDRFHEEIVDARGARVGQELADEARFVVQRGHGRAQGRALARPADFTHHDLLAREGFDELVIALEGIINSGFDRHAFVIRQEMDGDVIDVLGELRIAQPDVPGLGARHRFAHRLAHAVEIDDELVRLEVAAQDGFVADHQALDVTHLACCIDHRGDFALVLLHVRVQPGAGGDVHLALASQIEQLGHVGHAVGAQAVGDARQQIEIACELFACRVALLERALVTLKAVIGETLDALVGADEFRTVIELLPDPVLDERDPRSDGERDRETVDERGGLFHVES